MNYAGVNKRLAEIEAEAKDRLVEKLAVVIQGRGMYVESAVLSQLVEVHAHLGEDGRVSLEASVEYSAEAIAPSEGPETNRLKLMLEELLGEGGVHLDEVEFGRPVHRVGEDAMLPEEAAARMQAEMTAFEAAGYGHLLEGRHPCGGDCACAKKAAAAREACLQAVTSLNTIEMLLDREVVDREAVMAHIANVKGKINLILEQAPQPVPGELAVGSVVEKNVQQAQVSFGIFTEARRWRERNGLPATYSLAFHAYNVEGGVLEMIALATCEQGCYRLGILRDVEVINGQYRFKNEAEL